MVDYSQFEASTKSGIHADVNRIRQKDEIIRAVVKKRRNSAITCVCFVCMAGISLLKAGFLHMYSYCVAFPMAGGGEIF